MNATYRALPYTRPTTLTPTLLQVVIKDSHDDTGLCGQIGVVRGVTPGMCSVFLHEEERWAGGVCSGFRFI